MSRFDFEFDRFERIEDLRVTVELVAMTVVDGGLQVLMVERDYEPYGGTYVLPDMPMQAHTPLDDTAVVLRDTIGLPSVPLECFGGSSNPDRDPRARVVSSAYLALIDYGGIEHLVTLDDRFNLIDVEFDRGGDLAFSLWGKEVKIGFDHDVIIASAIRYVRRLLDSSILGFRLVPEYFTLPALQSVHEAFRGTRLNTPLFRKSMLARIFEDRTVLGPTPYEQPGRGRPAKIYRRVPVQSHGNCAGRAAA